jgi:hypothetical protein
MELMCPYCRVDYTLEAPCFCQAPLPADTAQPAMEARKGPSSESRRAPDIAIAAMLAVRLNRLTQLRVRA